MESEEPGGNAGTTKKKKKKGKTYGKTAKVGALWSVARQVLRHGVGIPASMVTARLLSPSEFGIAAAASFFLTLTSRVTELGLNQALVRVKHLRPEHKSSVFMVSLGFGVLTWLSLLLASPYIGNFFRSADVGRVVWVTSWGFLITPFSTVPSSLLQRDMRFKAMSFIDWIDMLVGAVVAIVLAWYGWSYWSLVYGQLVANTVTVINKMAFARWMPRFTWSREALGELWSFGLGIQIKRLLEFGAQNLDNLLIGRTIGIAALGLYDKAFMTTQRLQQTLNLGPAVSFRIFAILQDDAARFLRAYQKVLLTIGVIAIPPIAVCAATAPQLFDAMYGSKWLAAVPAFQILCIGSMIKLTSAHATRANEAQGMIWRQVLQHVGYVALIAIGVWIGSRWGITGAALGIAVARGTLAIFIHDLLRRTLGARWQAMLVPLVPGLFLAAMMAAIALATEYAIRYFFPSVSSVPLLLTQAAVAVVTYIPMVAYSPFDDLRVVVRETLEDFAPRFSQWVPAPSAAPDMELTKVG